MKIELTPGAEVVLRASEDPTLWRMREGGYRRVNCPVLRYFIAYIIRGETVVIIAVAIVTGNQTTG